MGFTYNETCTIRRHRHSQPMTLVISNKLWFFLLEIRTTSLWILETLTRPGKNALNVSDAIHDLVWSIEYGANLDLDQFKHVGSYSSETMMMEHYLEALSHQVIKLDVEEYVFEAGGGAQFSLPQAFGWWSREIRKHRRGVLKKTHFD